MSYYGRLMENDVALSSEEATKYISLTECLSPLFTEKRMRDRNGSKINCTGRH